MKKLITTLILATVTLTLNATVTMWDAYNDFYFDSTGYAQNGGTWSGATSPYQTAGGSAWGYYAANANWWGGYPGQIGVYFEPGTFTSGSTRSLYAMANYQPLLNNQQIAGGVPGSADAFDPIGGVDFARYADKYGFGVSIGRFNSPWFGGAPYYYGGGPGLWMQGAWLGGNSSQGEGIVPIVAWIAPYSGYFSFNGSFTIGDNGTSGPDGSYASVAIVGSDNSSLLSRTLVEQGLTYNFSFNKNMNAGDVVQFQVGTDYQIGAAVGLSAQIELIPEPSSGSLLTAGILSLGVLNACRRKKE